jgi:hypothetical protein
MYSMLPPTLVTGSIPVREQPDEQQPSTLKRWTTTALWPANAKAHVALCSLLYVIFRTKVHQTAKSKDSPAPGLNMSSSGKERWMTPDKTQETSPGRAAVTPNILLLVSISPRRRCASFSGAPVAAVAGRHRPLESTPSPSLEVIRVG